MQQAGECEGSGGCGGSSGSSGTDNNRAALAAAERLTERQEDGRQPGAGRPFATTNKSHSFSLDG